MSCFIRTPVSGQLFNLNTIALLQCDDDMCSMTGVDGKSQKVYNKDDTKQYAFFKCVYDHLNRVAWTVEHGKKDASLWWCPEGMYCYKNRT